MSNRSVYFLIFIVVSMIVMGVGKTIVQKLQNTTKAPTANGQYKKFQHPFMQTQMMFLGEAMCILIFLYIKRRSQYQLVSQDVVSKGTKEKTNYFLIIIPAVCDLLGTTLAFIGLNFISTSLYQMLRGGKMIATAILAHFFLKKQIKRYEFQGCAITLVGICIASVSSFVFPDQNAKSADFNSLYVISLVLVVVSVFLNGLQFVYEERLFRRFHLHQFEVIGVEGIWGFLIYIVISISLTFIECPESMQKQCLPKDGKYYFERADYYFEQIGANGLLAFWVVLGIVVIPLFNLSGISITKHLDSLARAMVDVTKLVLIWGVSLTLAFTVDPSWENTRWEAILVQIGGFSILVLGNIVYTGYFHKIQKPEKRVDSIQTPSSKATASPTEV